WERIAAGIGGVWIQERKRTLQSKNITPRWSALGRIGEITAGGVIVRSEGGAQGSLPAAGRIPGQTNSGRKVGINRVDSGFVRHSRVAGIEHARRGVRKYLAPDTLQKGILVERVDVPVGNDCRETGLPAQPEVYRQPRRYFPSIGAIQAQV